MSSKNTKRKKPIRDDDIASTQAAMEVESSEDEYEEVIGCRDGPYPEYDINNALDIVQRNTTFEELGVLEHKLTSSKSGKLTSFHNIAPKKSISSKNLVQSTKNITNKQCEDKSEPPARDMSPLPLASDATPPPPPTATNSVDESMVKFKGRSSLKQYMPQKPIKRGYKIWARCDVQNMPCTFMYYSLF